VTQKRLFKVIIDIIDERGPEAVPPIVDKLKKLGFRYATNQVRHGVLMR
jgi:hypothetical protein